MVEITIDPGELRKLNSAIEHFIKETGRDTVKVLKAQGRLLVRDLIRATPPFGKATFSESYNSQRRIGMAAVERDIRKVFVPLSQFVNRVADGNPNLAAALALNGGISGFDRTTKKSRQRISRVNMPALEAIFRNMGMDGRVIQNVDPGLHEAARNRRGVVKRATPYFVVNEKSLRDYIKEKQAHVGKAKAGWMKAAIGLAVKGIPNWIRAHLTPGVFIDRTGEGNSETSITVGNLIEYSEDFNPRIFEAAMKNRVRSMKTEMEKTAEYLARKANTRGRAV